MRTQKVWHSAMRLMPVVALFFACSTFAKPALEPTSKPAPKTPPRTESGDTKIPTTVEQLPDDRTRLSLTIDQPTEDPAAKQISQVACPAPLSIRQGAYEIGLGYGVLFPSGLVGASETLQTVSLALGVPAFGHTIQAIADFASTPAVRVLILELNLRWTFDSPYLNSYFVTGAHYLKQDSDSLATAGRDALGLTAGLGLAFDLGKNLEAHLDLKGFVQNRTTILFSGGFSVLL